MTDNSGVADWLALVKEMLPGAAAVVLYSSTRNSGRNGFTATPESFALSPEFGAFAKLAFRQQKTCISQAQDGTSWMAFPLDIAPDADKANPVLAVEFSSSTPSVDARQSACQWAAKWLARLLAQERALTHQLRRSSRQGQVKSSTFFALPGKLIDTLKQRKGRTLLFLAMGGLLLLLPLDYRIAVPTVIEGKIEAPVVAPFDGFISAAEVKAGESVRQGQRLAELDHKQLLIQREKLLSERTEKLNQYRTTLSTGDRAQARLLKAQLAQVEGDIAEVDWNISRAEITSPISGWVIAGDVRRSIGKQVQQGDLLYKVAPLNEYRAMLRIPETDVRYFQPGQSVSLKLFAFPGQSISSDLLTVSPIYQEQDGQVVYLAEADMALADTASLRPGMEGIAKVTVGTQLLGWQLVRRFSDWLRLTAWRLGF